MLITKDVDIRKRLHQLVLPQYARSGAFIVDELGLNYGANRVDVAVIGRYLMGFEIKSSQDNLKRLRAQFDEYSKSLQRVYLVCAENHFQEASEMLPPWVGSIKVVEGRGGIVKFEKVQTARTSPLFE
ncbi:MAG: hypothetical protein CME61_00415 [Halobacteriovoraceae bacterium]|nr:hypothetical protein [Halobacteriovoraceae bacterium]